MSEAPQKMVDIVSKYVWEFILTEFVARHSDAYDIRDTFSDTYTVFTMGSNPINVSLSGYLPLYQGSDKRLDFMYAYYNVLRGTMAKHYGVFTYFQIVDLLLAVDIQTFSIQQSSSLADMIPFSMTGVASTYYDNR
jgi:hypothetical protein